MANSLVPKLRAIHVSPSSLLLDPNNPRLRTHQDDHVPEDEYHLFECQKDTLEKMKKFNISELVEGIEINGFIPVDHMFVRKYRSTQQFLVLEGNRRVTAIKIILEKMKKVREKGEEVDEKLENALSEIKVMQIVDRGPEKDIREKITYLLGVRHHGSLQKWSSFARAKDVYLKYLALTRQTPDTFTWNAGDGETIAKSLSIPDDAVESSLSTYVAMRQLAEYGPVAKTKHKIKPSWFSLFRDSLTNKKLDEYLPRNDATFRLENKAVEKYDLLCKFSDPSGTRIGAPISPPQEWTKLGQICEANDATPEQRKENLRLVEDERVKPSIVQAKHKERVNPLTWFKWLHSVNSILSDISLADDTDSDSAKGVTGQLVEILGELDSRDVDPMEEA